MPPLYQMDDLVQHLNNIFSDGDRIKVNVGNIKNPSPDFARDIILEILSEAGYTLSPNVLSLPSSLIGQNELQYVNEFISPLTIMCGARRVFEDLVAASAAGENNPVNLSFGFNDLIAPEAKRFRFFLSHFINYWLFCNAKYQNYSDVDNQVTGKAHTKTAYETAINDYKRSNADLRKSKASADMKADKINARVSHDRQKLEKLAEDVAFLNKDVQNTKDGLAKSKAEETDMNQQTQQLIRVEQRLKIVSKADETKNDLENELQHLTDVEDEKLTQGHEHKIKAEALVGQEVNWKQIMANLSVVVALSAKIKAAINEKKALMVRCNSNHEDLSTIEVALIESQKAIATMKAEIANSNGKWDKSKTMRQADLLEYNEKLSTLTKALAEDDMVSHELDANISETMMELDGIRQAILDEEDQVKELFQKMMIGVDKFLTIMENDRQALKVGWKNLDNGTFICK